ncbi:pyridoxal phosphate-dependent transferase [Cladochytrium replicatum]|nr:pyridoxal phosphate-dependent transferase [Cladochytrium replicatum]
MSAMMKSIGSRTFPAGASSVSATIRSLSARAMSSSLDTKVLTAASVSPPIRNFEYAVRGALAIRAEELRNQLATHANGLPFSKITNCNIGNPQQLNQQPITFFRQVSALVEYPDLMTNPHAAHIFPQDAIARARKLLSEIGSVGAYSHSQGIPSIRKDVAAFIAERDGYPANPDDIFLTAGASPGVQLALQTIISHDKVGIMTPIPQYPLYSASITLFGGQLVPYNLNESQEWSLSVSALSESLAAARRKGIEVRALCVINPGNPTGQVLSFDNMKEIIKFVQKERLVLLADEVYQTNIYMPERLPFHSFKKVLKSLGPEYDSVELISFNSVSKGMIGECGRRGGYFECTGIDKSVKDLFYKVASVSLCPPVQGQVMVDLMVRPPVPGDASYESYKAEINTILESLKRRASKIAVALNALPGVTCNPAQGAMYLFPQIRLPPRAFSEAKSKNVQPDEMYCMELLNATGVCMIAGSGFGQEDGTWHFRTTFLPPEEEVDGFVERVGAFHRKFLEKYA